MTGDSLIHLDSVCLGLKKSGGFLGDDILSKAHRFFS